MGTGMRRIDTLDDIGEGLRQLAKADPRLAPVVARVPDVPLRRVPAGFPSLCSIITSQQVSLASAAAIFGRFSKLLDPLTPAAVLAAEDAVFREAGQSRAKQATLLAIAAEVAERGLDLDALCALDPEEATARLTAIRGVGPWTAELYLLFAAGHPDIFPSGDVALRTAAGEAFGLPERPADRALRLMSADWQPERSIAARLLWAYYAGRHKRDAMPVL